MPPSHLKRHSSEDDEHYETMERVNSAPTPTSGTGRNRRDSFPTSGNGKTMDYNDNFKVVIRVRPPAPRELEGDKQFQSIVKCHTEDKQTITIIEHLDTEDGRGGVYSTQAFAFDRVYDQDAMQQDVYVHTARPAVEAVLAGYNSTMIAYGQTGTGKTYTMEGVAKDKGIIPRATEDIFNFFKTCPTNKRYQVRASYMQIYNEVISDLLRPCAQALSVREGKDKGVYVKQLSSWPVRSAQEICTLMERGGRERVTGNTKMSELSSRSHAIFRIMVCETTMEGEGDNEQVSRVKVGQLNIVDLAGSEKVRQTGATGQRLEESKYINKSLSHLGNVIAALTTAKDSASRQHVPYRDSKLTRILEDSLGGNCKTTMIATISPAPESYTESLSTLKYANRAKNIKNDAVVNEDVGQKGLIKRYERELERLREQLSTVMEERRLSAPLQLNASVAGNTTLSEGGVDPNFTDAIHKVSAEYMARLDELDKERQLIEEDKAQVDRYKHILYQQRDIMIGLTARLNEKEESILWLQEELDAYDQQQRLMEEALDQRTEAMLRASVCGKCKSLSASAAANTAGRAATATSDIHRETVDGEARYLLEPDSLSAKSDAYDPSADRDNYVTPEEKVYELHGLLQQTRQELALQPPNICVRLQEAQEETQAMSYLVKERLHNMVSGEVGDKVTQFKREIEQWKSRFHAAEESARAAQNALELLRLEGGQHPDAVHARMKEFLSKEMAAIKQPHEERVEGIKRELDAKEAERRHAVKEAERLQFELFTVKRRYNIPETTATANMKEFNRLWQKVQEVEIEVRKQPGRQPFADVSNIQNTPGQASKAAALTQELDDARREAKKHSEESDRVRGSMQKEIASLQRALATHTKDREALKTIMETQIKVRIGSIGTLLHSSHLPNPSPEIRQRLENEVLQLQNYVNHFILQAI